MVALRGDRYKYITYYGLWDTDELYDIRSDPGETKNLIADSKLKPVVREMEDKLYGMLAESGGMFIPLNQPRGNSQNKRLKSRSKPGAFPGQLVVDEPINRSAR